MKIIIFSDEESALIACANLDTYFGYPKDEFDQAGRLVRCDRYTTPIELNDGTFAVLMDEILAVAINISRSRVVDCDIHVIRKQIIEID